MRYTGWRLYNRIKKCIEKAVYRVYNEDNTYCAVEEINLTYATCESEDEAPIVEVEFRYGQEEDTEYKKKWCDNMTVLFDLTASDEFNIGYINKCIETKDDEN